MSTPSHTTELWSANVSSWQLSWDKTSSSSVVPNNCAASEVLPSQADQHLLKENMPRTSSSYFHWVTTLHAPLLALWPWCGFQIIQDNCAYLGLCACCSFWMPSLSSQPLSGDHLHIFQAPWLHAAFPDSSLKKPTTPSSRPRMYPEQTYLTALCLLPLIWKLFFF